MNQPVICEGNQEEDIDQMISDADIYKDNQGMERIPADNPPNLRRRLGMRPTVKEKLEWDQNYEHARQDNVRKRKQRRVQGLHASLSRLSASFLAAISVVERQIAILLNLQRLFLTSHRTETNDYGKEYHLRQTPFYTNIAPILLPLENPDEIWPKTLEAIDEVVRERKCSLEKIKVLVENMEVKKEIV